MADTAVSSTNLSVNTPLDDPAGTAVSNGNTAVITAGDARHLVLRIEETGSAAATVTFRADPNNRAASQRSDGDLVVELEADEVVFIQVEAGRFVRFGAANTSTGVRSTTVRADVSGAVSVTAFRVDRLV